MLRINLVLIFIVSGYIVFSQGNTTLILTRHAEKVESNDRNPVLSEEGILRSQKLATALSKVPITAIYSSDYIRTRETVQPTAQTKNIEIKLYDPRDKVFIEKLIREEKGGTILISGHSNTIPAMINQLAQTNYPNFSEKDYDNLVFVIIKLENEPIVIWLKHN